MKKLLTIIAALVIIAGVSEAREIKRMQASTKRLKLYKPHAAQQAPRQVAPTDAAIMAHRAILTRRVKEAEAAFETARANLVSFEIKAAEAAEAAGL